MWTPAFCDRMPPKVCRLQPRILVICATGWNVTSWHINAWHFRYGFIIGSVIERRFPNALTKTVTTIQADHDPIVQICFGNHKGNHEDYGPKLGVPFFWWVWASFLLTQILETAKLGPQNPGGCSSKKQKAPARNAPVLIGIGFYQTMLISRL